MSKGKLALGILGAVAAGAVIGLLLAPDSGKKIKKKILNKSKSVVGEIKGKFDNLLKNMSKEQEDALKKSKKLVTITK